ncbi:hypothetical protein ACEPAF_1569 [Sanghuangporus sanghuang]
MLESAESEAKLGRVRKSTVQEDALADAKSVSLRSAEVDMNEWVTTKRELWAFYVFYIGNNGLSGFNFGPSQFQNLLFLAGYDPAQPPFSVPCGSDTGCVLPFLGALRDINSIVLVTNGISFAIQAVLFLMIGAWADYGRWRPNITIFFTVLAVAVSFAWLGVEDASKWKAGVALYILGLITFQGALTFWTAAFPGLARDLPEVRASAKEVQNGDKLPEEHAKFESLHRNRISNVAFAICSMGEILILAVMVGILKALKSDESTANNTKAFSVLIAFSGGVWLLCALPWFLLEKRRPGLSLPPGTSLLTIGFRQTYIALRECMKLKQTFLYLIFYFVMGDVLNTTVTVIATLQNSVVSYSTLQLTLLLIVGIFAQGLGIWLFWLVQKRYKISTKAMLTFNCTWIIILTIWGLVGVHTDRFGFKHVWEIWLYQAYYGLMVCPWYAYSQTMISEVSPLSQMFLFFALFSIVGKTSAFIGPFVSSAIIDDSGGNNNMPFSFLFTLSVLSMILLYKVDVGKSRKECEAFLAAEASRAAFGTSHFDADILEPTAFNIVHNYDKAIRKRGATRNGMEDSSVASYPILSGDALACSLPTSGPHEARTPSPRAIENDVLPYFEEDETDLNSSPLFRMPHDDVASSSQLRRFTSMFKSPRRPKFVPPKDAPVVRKLNGLDDTLISNKAENNAYHHAKEGHKVVIGPMPCRQFLDEFLPTPPDNMPDHRGAFNKVPTKPRREKEIYLPLTEAMNHNHRCPGVQFCITCDLSDEEGRGSLKPDIDYYDEAKYESNLGLAQFFVEGKGKDDPLCDVHSHAEGKKATRKHFISYFNHKHIDEKNETDAGKRERRNFGQKFTYAAECFKRQHRIFYFSIMIVCTRARFFSWDRAGCIVSKSFDYKKYPKLLCEFLWRFGHANAVQRGFDPTVTMASPEEEELFRTVVRRHVAFQLGISEDDAESLDDALSQHYEKGKVTKASVYNRNEPSPTFYLISVPLKTANSVAGHCTTVYWAVELIGPNKGKVRCLKDSWRVDRTSVKVEGAIYCEMEQQQVENICNLKAYGDVRDIVLIEEDDSDTCEQQDVLQNESGNKRASESLNSLSESHFADTDLPEFELNADNEFQCTRTNDYVNARWVCKCLRGNLRSRIPRRVHNRLVLKQAGYALRSFCGSRELFIGAKDALGALDSAYSKCGRLHRDVSIGNIILYRFAATEPRRGLLIDWEFSTSVDDTDVATDYYRSGTWAFMSIRALSGKNFQHTQEDDMESLLYVVTYGSVRWLPHEHIPKLGQWIYEFFSSSKENDEGQDTGGVYKELQQSVSGSKFLDTFGFKSEYIRKWFRGAYGYLNTVHESEKAKGTKSEWTMKNLRELFTSVCHYLLTTEETKLDRTEHSVEDYYVEANKARRGTHTSLGRKSVVQGSAQSNRMQLYNGSVPSKRRRSEDHEEQDDQVGGKRSARKWAIGKHSVGS